MVNYCFTLDFLLFLCEKKIYIHAYIHVWFKLKYGCNYLILS